MNKHTSLTLSSISILVLIGVFALAADFRLTTNMDGLGNNITNLTNVGATRLTLGGQAITAWSQVNASGGGSFSNGSDITVRNLTITGYASLNNSPASCASVGTNVFTVQNNLSSQTCSALNQSAIVLKSLGGKLNITQVNATNSPSTGDVLTYSGSNDQFTWAADQTGGGSGGGWVPLQAFNLSANTTGVFWSANAAYNYYQICLSLLKGETVNAGSISLIVNDDTSGYKYNSLAYSTLSNPSGVNAWNLTGSGTGTNSAVGCLVLNRGQIPRIGDTVLSGTIAGSDQYVFWGGRNTNIDNTNVTNISIKDVGGNTNITGTVSILGLV